MECKRLFSFSHIYIFCCVNNISVYTLPCIKSLNLGLFTASGPATPDSAENTAQHLSPESTRKAYWRTWDGSTGTQHMPQSPNVFSEHLTGSNMSPSSLGHLKSPAPGRTRSVSDSSAPRRGNVIKHVCFHVSCHYKINPGKCS